MNLTQRKSKHYNFYLAKFWLVGILVSCISVNVIAANKFMATTNASILLWWGVAFVIAGLISIKFIGLLTRSRQPIISIRRNSIVIKHKKRLEIPFNKINSVNLATSGFQMFNQSLLIFLNNASDNEDSDLPVISVPLILVRADRKHLLQLIKLHLNRSKPYDISTATIDLELDLQAI